MRLTMDDFGTGWFGLGIGLRPAELDRMIELLSYLRDGTQEGRHFHVSSTGSGPTPGMADIQFYVLPADQQDNAEIG